MQTRPHIPTSRIEAFSDGVIAIIITVMVFDLKLPDISPGASLWHALVELLPRFGSYILSFLIIAIMWVNHHQLFHQVKHSTGGLLWYNLHLLFWMSLVPFVTHFLGAHLWQWQAAFSYGLVFFMTAWAFTLLRGYVIRHDLLHATISRQAHIRIRNKNRLSMSIYLAAALLSPVSVYISFALFLVVPAMYFVPEKIIHTTN